MGLGHSQLVHRRVAHNQKYGLEEVVGYDPFILGSAMEQCALKNVNNCSKTNIYSYLETSGG